MSSPLLTAVKSVATSLNIVDQSQLARFETHVEERRFTRDVAAVMASFDRLNERQLHLVGINRGDLFEAVSDMIVSAEEKRHAGREILALLEDAETSGKDVVQGHVTPVQASAAHEKAA